MSKTIQFLGHSLIESGEEQFLAGEIERDLTEVRYVTSIYGFVFTATIVV